MEQQKENAFDHETIAHAEAQLREEHTESRSEYQKRKRDEKKEQNRKKRRNHILSYPLDFR